MKKCFQLIKDTPIPKNERDFKVKKEIPSNFLQSKRKSFQFQTTSLNGNFQTLNTKVRIDEEILQTTNASKMNAKGAITQFNERMQNPKQNKLIAKD